MDDDTIGSKNIKKHEFVRLISEALQSLGYKKTSSVLESESHISLYSPDVSAFYEHILERSWDQSLTALRAISGLDEPTYKSMAYVILEQKYLQLLDDGKNDVAVMTLKEIEPFTVDPKRVKDLSSMVLNPASAEKPKPQDEVLMTLNKLIPPPVIVPQQRLLKLLEQALQNSVPGSSLLAAGTRIPSHTVQILKGHKDEVNFIHFSHNGKYLASASKDTCAIIWRVGNDGILERRHTLFGHQKPVYCISWSPDDQQLLTCGEEEVVRRWDVLSGRCLCVYIKRNRGMISCDWSPDGESIFFGLTSGSIMMWNLDARTLTSWMRSTTSKTSDLQITSNGRRIISLLNDKTISIVDRESGIPTNIKEDANIVSFVLAGDDRFLLVSLQNQEIHLWSIEGEMQVVNTYKGHICSRFIVRACFGGDGQTLVASGSEDSRVYIWHRESGDLLKTLGGHAEPVNCTSWNPVNPTMLASGSVDKTIRIWGVNPNQD